LLCARLLRVLLGIPTDHAKECGKPVPLVRKGCLPLRAMYDTRTIIIVNSVTATRLAGNSGIPPPPPVVLDVELCGVVDTEELLDEVETVELVEEIDDVVGVVDDVEVLEVVDVVEVDGEGVTTETEFEPKLAT